MKNLLQKIKIPIILTIIAIILAIGCVFYNNFNILIHNFMLNNNIVSTHQNMLVHFVSVGQGDAIAINLPSGKTLLIDTGKTSSNVDYARYLKNKVINNSRSNKIDYLILTHADADHVGGTMKLLSEFEIGFVYMPSVDSETETFTKIKNEVLNSYNYQVLAGNLNIEEEGVNITNFQLLQSENANDSCPVIKMEYKSKSFLFTGDISNEAERALVEEFSSKLNSDVLKVSHHGSETSSSDQFLSAVSPEYSVISVGDNSYGHPASEVLNRLNSAGAEVLRTDENGNILFVVGESYGLINICDDYYITNIIFDYRIFVAVLDGVIFVFVVICLVKNLKQIRDK